MNIIELDQFHKSIVIGKENLGSKSVLVNILSSTSNMLEDRPEDLGIIL